MEDHSGAYDKSDRAGRPASSLGHSATIPSANHPHPTDAFAAWAVFKRLMREDANYAWAWHCNIAMPVMDAIGCTADQANQAAAHLMSHLFEYDITKHPLYEGGKSAAQEYQEMRIAAEREDDA